MSDVIDTPIYEAVLVGQNDEEQVKTFSRLTEAILWVSRECTASKVQQGVVRFNGDVLWRKRIVTLPSAPPLAPDAPQDPSTELETAKADSAGTPEPQG